MTQGSQGRLEVGGVMLSFIGGSLWLAAAIADAVIAELPPVVRFLPGALLAGFSIVWSVRDAANGMWVRGIRGLMAGFVLALLMAYLWLTSGSAL